MVVLYISLIIVILDQLTKFLVKGGTIPLLNLHVQGMDYGSSINVFGDFFKITFVENPGLAFGIDVNETSKLFLSLFSLAASIGILYYIYKSKEQKLIVRIALAFILGGAVGNLIDRMFYGVFYGYAPVFYGKVVDFFNADFFDFTIFGRTYDRFPIFNIADSSVTVGVILLILFHKSVEEKKEISVEANSVVVEGETNPELPSENNNQEMMIDGEDSNRKKDKD
ncbi:MAG: signal peptidase II [Stygiobacter sp. RIFOXYC12_FULL_38_8]|nr:MAG: signal peptidase II [Stygiobacter sp. RIFOXYA12_FULL_38_9]OGV07351.1 MAG: signal peptidase II [Stygiobacter sp. RIFOXYB2_FULL_37_11]OGV09863.1 MAG: signal peptidase II [Stygiobacter sp. RIFOXYA2_FULL_38_8]OGV16200.1 MAG: signal peptidase II [Stygiobacter sp. RIFOXYC2_FULL_38_25]OGV29661.1 MAG: signal peptidase II [Stygiobacter sp. RIFOXYC12_FULL_38_8]OGV81706.1 MAG: signal peptidase II [Stygiobacter sp. GWF2_38_21]RJQ59165.1 MAG: signal peptidase II [Stygiobacter sp.]